MNKLIKVVGLDPSLSNFGISVGSLNIDTNDLVIERFHLVETKSGDKKSIRVNSDDLRRASEIWKIVKPVVDEANLVFCELPVGSQSSRAQTSYGICIGVLACIQKPLIQMTPNEIKMFVGNRKDTTKEAIIQWAVEKQPNAPWLTKISKGQTTLLGKNEHLADSVAAIYAGLETDQYKQAVSMMRAFF